MIGIQESDGMMHAVWECLFKHMLIYQHLATVHRSTKSVLLCALTDTVQHATAQIKEKCEVQFTSADIDPSYRSGQPLAVDPHPPIDVNQTEHIPTINPVLFDQTPVVQGLPVQQRYSTQNSRFYLRNLLNRPK